MAGSLPVDPLRYPLSTLALTEIKDEHLKHVLAQAVRECYNRKIFFPGGASRFVKAVEKRIGKKEGQDA